jgi:hypothetical protein
MEPIIATIIIILGKYALDQGATMAALIGPKALDTAKEMFRLVIDRISLSKPDIAAEFSKDPQTYQKSLKKSLQEEAANDDDFNKQLKTLLLNYETYAEEFQNGLAEKSNTTKLSEVQVRGRNVTASSGGIAIGGDVINERCIRDTDCSF